MVGIIDYSVGNTGSILNMLKKIGVDAVLSADEQVLSQTDKLILPGVGAFDAGMENLQQKGLLPILNRLVLDERKPLLGICLGMQLLGTGSEEGVSPGLGWLDFKSVKFRVENCNGKYKVPHMGWNYLSIRKECPLLNNMPDDSRFYFVHSYHARVADSEISLAETDYGYAFASVVGKDNIFGVQFHPEKSHRFGMKLLENYARYC